jgi:hypothetical protein
MAIDRLGNPIAKDNLVRIPVRPVRTLQVDPTAWDENQQTPTLFVYPGRADGEDPDAAREYLTGRVLAISEDPVLTGGPAAIAQVKVQGIEGPIWIDTRLLEKTA